MIYLASPYTDPDPLIMEWRYLSASFAVTSLLQERKWVYSPIVHCHELAKIWSLPRDSVFWKEYNFHMMSRATEMRILRLDGWAESVGIKEELDHSIKLNLPVWYI